MSLRLKNKPYDLWSSPTLTLPLVWLCTPEPNELSHPLFKKKEISSSVAWCNRHEKITEREKSRQGVIPSAPRGPINMPYKDMWVCRGSRADVAFLFFCFFTGQPVSDDFHQMVWVMWFQWRSGHLAACSPWPRGTCSRRWNNNTAGTFLVQINKQPALREGKVCWTDVFLLQAHFLEDIGKHPILLSSTKKVAGLICPSVEEHVHVSASLFDPRSPQKVHFPSDFVLKGKFSWNQTCLQTTMIYV